MQLRPMMQHAYRVPRVWVGSRPRIRPLISQTPSNLSCGACTACTACMVVVVSACSLLVHMPNDSLPNEGPRSKARIYRSAQ